MIAKILEKFTGKDDLERVAYKENLELLNAYLKKRHVFVPQRPKRFLDAATFTQEQLMEQIRSDRSSWVVTNSSLGFWGLTARSGYQCFRAKNA